MSLFSILESDTSDVGTIVASSEASGTPASNLLNLQPQIIWKTTGDAAEYIEIDFGSVKEFDQIYLGFTNLTSNATARIRSADTQGNLTASPDFDSGTFTAYTQANPTATPLSRNHVFHPLSPSKTNRWVRVDLADSTNPAGFITAGRLIIGKAFKPGDNISIKVPYSLGALDRSSKITRRDGGTEIDVKPKINNLRASIETRGNDDEDEFMNNLDEILRNKAGSTPVLVVIEPDDNSHRHKKLFYGLVESTLPIIKLHAGSSKRYRLTFNVQEMI